MKIIAWNVNGLRSSLKSNEMKEMIDNMKPDIFCIGETKLSCPYDDVEKTIIEMFPQFKYRYWSPCKTKGGYSGTAIFCKKEPLKVIYGLKCGKASNEEMDMEGRVISIELKKYWLVHVYTPNSGQGLNRLEYRTKEWDRAFELHIKKLQEEKPIIVCGDMNVARSENDLARPKTNHKTAGFTDEERESFEKILKSCDLVDSYRYMNPNKIEYSFWTYMMKAREKNIGWRIDYFLVSSNIKNKVKKSEILTNIMGSDHAPIFLKI
jgi:exodeoxyribonuclease-3